MIGILVSNLGTPDAPTPEALKRYLKQFLSDRRVVDVPRPIWWFILNFFILPRRAPKSASLYQKVWTPEGSPLLSFSKGLTQKIAAAIQPRIPVALGMRYGNPCLEDALLELKRQGCRRILVLPLYPQYSSATTASTFDEIARLMKNWRDVPEFKWINDYHDHPAYVNALADSIREHRKTVTAPQKLLFSFHGIPKRYQAEGDPYYYQCHGTARAVARNLRLDDASWSVAFQSRFGKEEWLKPYTDATLAEWAKSGIGSVEVICAGFPADCLETLEEIAEGERENFIHAGGKEFHYIPALNDSDAHASAMITILQERLRDWI